MKPRYLMKPLKLYQLYLRNVDEKKIISMKKVKGRLGAFFILVKYLFLEKSFFLEKDNIKLLK